MKVAMIAPPWFPVPPIDYGGTERVCALVARGLQDRGHDVTLYASGDSDAPVPLRGAIAEHNPARLRWPEVEAHHLAFALAEIEQYDVVHDNSSVFGPLLWSQTEMPVLHTVHGGLEDADARAVYRRVCDRIDLVALSSSHAKEAPEMRWADVIPNPVDIESMPFVAQKGEGVVFLGRISPEKAPHLAIEAAGLAGVNLTIAGPVHDVNREYFECEVEPLLAADHVSYVGSVGGVARGRLLAEARAILLPICWREPFGLAAVEAMACGTPAIAFPRGALAETVTDGVSGFLVEDVAQMAEAIAQTGQIDPWACREEVRERFSIATVAERYETALERVSGSRRSEVELGEYV